ncbi:MAG: BON domain-containing protein [Spongiibacteraceae bacterium]
MSTINSSKKTLAKKSLAISIAAAAISSSLVFAAPGENHMTKHDSNQQDKRSAEQYWQEFKQDSKQTWKDTNSAFRDGWVESKLETSLIINEHLNPFDIDIRVDNDTATLDGSVSTDIEKELAENIALGIEGIDDVENNLRVDKNSRKAEKKSESSDFSQRMKDATITASVKTKLLASSNVSGLSINVDTKNSHVTLKGNVDTETQKDLAEAIAKGIDNVSSVDNELKVKS